MKNLEFSLKDGGFEELEFQPLGIASGEVDGKTYVVVADYFGPLGIKEKGTVPYTNGRFIAYEVHIEGDKLILVPSHIYPLDDPSGGDIPKENPLWTGYPSSSKNNRAQSLVITPEEEILFTGNLESWLNGMNSEGVTTLRIPYENGFGKIPGERTESIGLLEGILYSVNNFGTELVAYEMDREKAQLNEVTRVKLDEIKNMKDYLRNTEIEIPRFDPTKKWEEQLDLVKYLMYGIGIKDNLLWLISEHRGENVKDGIYVIDPSDFSLVDMHSPYGSFPNNKITGNGVAFVEEGIFVTQYTFDREKDIGKPKLVYIPNNRLRMSI